MAYKFQRLAARMSGSLTQEGNIAITTDTGVTVSIIDQYGLISGSSDLQAGGNLVVAGTVTLAGVSDTAIAVGSDALYFKDADGTMKSDTVADLMTAAAGAGTSATAAGVCGPLRQGGRYRSIAPSTLSVRATIPRTASAASSAASVRTHAVATPPKAGRSA